MSAATPADLHRLALLGKERCLQIFQDFHGGYFVTSFRAPDRLHHVTAVSCDSPAFITHGRCSHHALLLADLGWLPPLDDEPDPAAPGAAAVPVPEEIGETATIVLLRPSP